MKIDVKVSGMAELKLRLAGLERKIPTITKAALNDAAYLGTQKTKAALASSFDRITPWIRNSVRYKKATPQKLEAMIDFEQWGNKTAVTAAMVLAAEIYGGRRKLKRHEIALQRAGILPAGMAIVPGPAADIDQYGNMRAAQIVQIVSYFKAFGEQGYRANMRDGGKRLARDNKRTGARGFAYFVLQKPHGKLHPGIYQRYTFAAGSAVKPVMYFVRVPAYRQRLDFYDIAQKAAEPEFHRAFSAYAEQFMRERGL
jgi:hypothetical protein